jgi:hypothetical protein
MRLGLAGDEMTSSEFETLLTAVADRLTQDVQRAKTYHAPREFEGRARAHLQDLGRRHSIKVDLSPHAQLFPDIAIGKFGVEVKVVNADSWRTVANSIFEGTRDPNVEHIYVLYGKLGGAPLVRWGKYENCVMHVRTSHVPRFEVDLDAKISLFSKFGIAYKDFCDLEAEQKMHFVRKYARARLKPGDRLWWLEEKPEEAQEHSLPLEVRLYMGLSQEEKRRLRAEAALLCPQVVKPSRSKKKYDDAAMYLITYHGVLCSQARDLFSAGSVAHRENRTRGGNYVMLALRDIEGEMREAAKRLEDALLVEYWGKSVRPADRIKEWLKMADKLAKDWIPSRELFR